MKIVSERIPAEYDFTDDLRDRYFQVDWEERLVVSIGELGVALTARLDEDHLDTTSHQRLVAMQGGGSTGLVRFLERLALSGAGPEAEFNGVIWQFRMGKYLSIFFCVLWFKLWPLTWRY